MTTFAVLPLAAILPNSRNIRTQLGDLTEITTSIKEQGLIEPLIVAPRAIGTGKGTCPDCATHQETRADGTLLEHQDPEAGACPGGGRYASDLYELVDGHRRRAGCEAAGLGEVPAIIREDLTKPGPQILVMLTGPGTREGLSPMEEAAAYEQLQLLGYKPAQIAKDTGRARATVDKRLALLKLPEKVRDKVHAHQVTLADAEAMTEFAGDTKAMKALEAAAGAHNFRWKLEEIRQRRQQAREAAAAKTKLLQAGVTVIKRPKGYPHSSTEKPVAQYAWQPGAVKMTPEDHASCPHHAALEPSSSHVEYVCTDPAVHQGQQAANASGLSKAEQKRRTAEEKKAAAEQAELDTAAAVRAQWLTGWLRDVAPDAADAAEVLKLVAATVAVEVMEPDPQTWLRWLGVEPPDTDVDTWEWGQNQIVDAVDNAGALTAARSPLKLVVAMLAAQHDGPLTQKHGWRADCTLGWLDLLQHLGYRPSDVERRYYDGERARRSELAARHVVESAQTQEANTEQAEDQEVPA